MASPPREDAGAALLDPVLECARLAVITGASPVLVVVAAVAAMKGRTARELADRLSARAAAIDRLLEDGAGPRSRRPAPLEPSLRFEPELAAVRPELADHEIRGRLLFRDLLATMSFVQVAAWAVGGVTLSAGDAELLDRSGVLTQLMAPEIWPLALTRRIAAGGGGLGAALVGGVAALSTPKLAGLPVAGFMRFLDRVELELAAGRTVDEVVASALSSGERVAGIGRPVLGPDERVPHQVALFARYGRAEGGSVKLALSIDRAASQGAKGLRLNAAGMHGALMRDLGFSPAAAAAIATLYFIVPVLAHAVFAEEQAASKHRR